MEKLIREGEVLGDQKRAGVLAARIEGRDTDLND